MPSQLRPQALSDDLYNYVLQHGTVTEHACLAKLRMATAKLDNAHMQIAPDQGQFMALLATIMQAKTYLEIGVFTGYSALTMALAMGENSTVIALDNNLDYLNIAKQFWQEAHVMQQMQIMHGNALDSLAKLCQDSKKLNSVDIAFIDANKSDYLAYYEYCYQLVRPGGVILVDNVLYHGQVVNPDNNMAQAIDSFNQVIKKDARVRVSMLGGLGDGLSIVYKG